MQLTQQIKINVSYQQELIISALSEKCRLIYNFALTERKLAYEQGKKINYIKQQNDLPSIKEKFPEYAWVYSKVLQYALRTLDADYKSFFALRKKGDENAQLPHYKGKKFFTTMVYNQSGFKVGKGFVELSHKHPLKTKLRFVIPDKFRFELVQQVSLYKKGDSYFLSLVYVKNPQKQAINNQFQAFDLGVMKHTAVNSQGKFIEFENQRSDKYWEKPIGELQSRRDHCKKYSVKWHKLNTLMNGCKRKSSNQLKDFQHKLSRKIVDNTKANIIIIGDLNIKEMCKNKHQKGLHKSLHNTGNIARFTRFLTYKAELLGKRIVEISERKTSKTCCLCGKEKAMPLYERTYRCDCGNTIDRDKNSSVNIMLRFLSENALWTSYWQFVSNLRQTGLTIVSHSQEATSSIKVKP